MLTGHVDEVGITLLIAAVYLLVVRFLDLNEREPLWSVLLLFSLGAASSLLLRLLVSSVVLELRVLPGAAWKEGAKFLAIALGAVVLSGVGRLRGWSDLNGLLDGLVYGVAAGLGFATGETLVGLLAAHANSLAAATAGGMGFVAQTALAGLAEGVFAGATGAGFGLAAQGRRAWTRLAGPPAGLLVAVLLHAAYEVLAHGNALAGREGLVRAWLALLLPVVVVLVVAERAFRAERRAIRQELATELGPDGVVTDGDLALLTSVGRRQVAYLGALATADLRRFTGLAALHNRQVQLALAKRRERSEADPQRRAALAARVGALRAAVRQARVVVE